MSLSLDFVEPPTCPMCSTNDRVERDTIGGTRDTSARQCWVCCHCWTAFDGGQGEWERNRERRERRDACSENMAATFHAENVARGGPPVWAVGGLLVRIEKALASEESRASHP